MAWLSMPQPDLYRRAIRGSGVTWWYTVNATLGGAPVLGATGLRPTSGQITDTTRPGVRRNLSLTVVTQRASVLYDALAPLGTRLTATCHVRYGNRSAVQIPMGVFDVDRQQMTEGDGRLTLTAPDKWARIKAARFLKPQASSKNATVTSQIAELIRGALGPDEPVNITATSTERVGALTWEKDRDKAIIDLATTIGAWVFFDRDGVATIADIPTIGAEADWLVNAAPTGGVLTELNRERSRADAANIVVVESSGAGEAKFATLYVWDNDVNSPTFAGPGTGVGSTPPPPGSAGPFGQVPHYHDSNVLSSVAAARATGQTLLARLTGLASQVALGQVPNPAVDAFDVIDVLPPEERYDLPRAVERHVADTVTHPLSMASNQTQAIEGRSTRAEEVA